MVMAAAISSGLMRTADTPTTAVRITTTEATGARTTIRTTTMAFTCTDTCRRTTTRRRITGGPTIRGLRRRRMHGDGERLPGMDITERTISHTRYIRARRTG